MTLDILIPHFNDPKGLSLSLKSVVRQTWAGTKRVVVVDDGSSRDVSLAVEAIVEKFREKHSDAYPLRISLLRNDTNRGLPYTRNVLLGAIEGTHVSWLDAGDEWYPGKLAAQFRTLEWIAREQPDRPALVTCNYDWIGTDGVRGKRVQHTGQDQLKALLLGEKLRAYLWTIIGNAEHFKSIGMFDEKLTRLQDLDYFLRFVESGGKIYRNLSSDACCAYYKTYVGRNSTEIRRCNQYILIKHQDKYEKYGSRFARRCRYNMDMLSARCARENHEYLKTIFYMASALRRRPGAFLKAIRPKAASSRKSRPKVRTSI